MSALIERLSAAPESGSKWTILCDFDGTISTVDVTDALLESFARSPWRELESRWSRGEIGSRECMSGQIELLDVSRAELDAALSAIEIDASFAEFVEHARTRDMPLLIASDGLDYVVRTVLARHGLDDIPVIANQLVQVSERRWRLQFPNARSDCRRACGNCKCALAQERSLNASVLYIGDGASDFCVAHRVDLVLAKGNLIEYSRSNAIAHQPIAGFKEAISILARLGASATRPPRLASESVPMVQRD